MNAVAIIQARMGSTRLPGKVLMDLGGEPMLARVVARTGRATTVDRVVVATTGEPADQAIVACCEARGWPCFRGSQEDVLDRYYQAARQHRADAVVRITSDCPLIDPAVIDRVVAEFLQRQPQVALACNEFPRRTFPRGLDTEVIRFDVLEQVWREARDKPSREHVTYYVYQHPERFLIHAVENDVDYSQMRWTVDTPEDLELVRRIYAYFGDDRFGWQDVLAAVQQHPQWQEINRHMQQKSV